MVAAGKGTPSARGVPTRRNVDGTERAPLDAPTSRRRSGPEPKPRSRRVVSVGRDAPNLARAAAERAQPRPGEHTHPHEPVTLTVLAAAGALADVFRETYLPADDGGVCAPCAARRAVLVSQWPELVDALDALLRSFGIEVPNQS